MAKRKVIITGTHGKYMGRYKGRGFNDTITWHRIPANSKKEAKEKMLKGTRFTPDEVIIRKYNPKVRG